MPPITPAQTCRWLGGAAGLAVLLACTPLHAQSFRVTSQGRTNGAFGLTWESVGGKGYRVEFKTNLTDAAWNADPLPVLAAGASTSWRDSDIETPAGRFYRVVEPGGLVFSNPGPGGGSFLMSIAIHPEHADVAYIGGDIEAPFKTVDGGQNYRRISGNLAGGDHNAGVYAAQTLAIDPANPARLYMASWAGLYRTDNEGRTWTRLEVDPDESMGEHLLASVAVSPFNSNVILTGTGNILDNSEGTGKLYRSTDGGATFVNTTAAGPFSRTTNTIHVIVFDPLQAGAVYAGTGEGVLKSADNGASWALANTGLPNGVDGAPIVHGLIAVTNGAQVVLFASLRTQESTHFTAGGVFRSLDRAATWQDITGNLPRKQDVPEDPLAYIWWRLAAHPANPNRLFVGTKFGGAYEGMGIYRTDNALAPAPGDARWAFMTPLNAFTDPSWLSEPWWNDLHIAFLAIPPSAPDTLYAGRDRVFKSANDGDTWTEAYSQTVGVNTHRGRGLECMEPFSIAIHPSAPERWWVGYDDMGLWRTDDAGATWVRMDPLQNSPAVGETDCAYSVLLDPDDPNILYVGRNGGEFDGRIDWPVGLLFKSIDAGVNWTRLGETEFRNGGQGGRLAVLMLPGGAPTARTIFCGVYGQRLFKSTDAGATWTASDAGMWAFDRAHVWSLAFDPQDPSSVYAGIADAGELTGGGNGAIYKSTDGGATWTKLTGTVPTGQIADLAVASDGTVYAASTPHYHTLASGMGAKQGGVYRSADGGSTWTRPLTADGILSVHVAPTDPRLVIAGVASRFDRTDGHNAGLYISRDSGMTFHRESEGLAHTRIWFARFHPTDANTVFVGTGGGGLFVGRGAAP